MSGDALIDRLVADLKPVRRGSVAVRFALGLGLGIAVAAILMLFWLGVRPDFATAVAAFSYWMKFAFTLAVGVLGFLAVDRLARPGGRAPKPAIALLLVFAVMALLAVIETIGAAPADRGRLLLGASANACPWLIIALSAPLFVGALWAMRGLAPTRLTLAGAAAGLMAGGFGAWVYAFHCDENAAAFVAVWYSLGIGVVTLFGALTGRFLLRW